MAYLRESSCRTLGAIWLSWTTQLLHPPVWHFPGQYRYHQQRRNLCVHELLAHEAVAMIRMGSLRVYEHPLNTMSITLEFNGISSFGTHIYAVTIGSWLSTRAYC